MADGPIRSVIHTVNIDTMLSNNDVNYALGIKNVKCKQTLTLDLLLNTFMLHMAMML